MRTASHASSLDAVFLLCVRRVQALETCEAYPTGQWSDCGSFLPRTHSHALPADLFLAMEHRRMPCRASTSCIKHRPVSRIRLTFAALLGCSVSGRGMPKGHPLRGLAAPLVAALEHGVKMMPNWRGSVGSGSRLLDYGHEISAPTARSIMRPSFSSAALSLASP